MSGVFRNIDPPPPHRPGAGEDTLAGWEVEGVNSSEDVRHCSVLYICKFFVVLSANSALAGLATHTSKFVINPSAFVIVNLYFAGTLHAARAMVD
jgi:hypothetical protein